MELTETKKLIEMMLKNRYGEHNEKYNNFNAEAIAAAIHERMKEEDERPRKHLKLVIDRYMTCLEILGERYQHPFVPAYWNELIDLVHGNLDADSECEQYWNEMKARIDAAYEASVSK